MQLVAPRKQCWRTYQPSKTARLLGDKNINEPYTFFVKFRVFKWKRIPSKPFGTYKLWMGHWDLNTGSEYGTKRETRCLPTDAPAQLLNLTYVAARENCFNLCRLASKTKQISVLCVTLHFHANVQFQVLSVSEFPYVRGRVRSSWSCR